MNISQQTQLLKTLQRRFDEHMFRHQDITWKLVEKKLLSSRKALETLFLMEETKGDPDVVFLDNNDHTIWFMDCSEQSPLGRRSLCYDDVALQARKANKPKASAFNTALDMEATLLNEEQYFFLQTKGTFDTKSSSWLLTPASMRKLGGALFGDHRYGRTFVFHNGADSYYGDRGFRVVLKV
jgi:hypothetical protein